MFASLPIPGAIRLDRADANLIDADPGATGDGIPAELNPVIDHLDHEDRAGR